MDTVSLAFIQITSTLKIIRIVIKSAYLVPFISFLPLPLLPPSLPPPTQDTNKSIYVNDYGFAHFTPPPPHRVPPCFILFYKSGNLEGVYWKVLVSSV